jgi:hypothetical protein
LLALLDCGCAGVRSELISSNPPRYLVTCKRSDSCYRGAAKSCPAGFDIVDHAGETQSVSRVGDTLVVHNRSSLVVQCRSELTARE